VTLEELHRLAGDCQVAVARELTKAHEQLVRGPISHVLNELQEERGEFTIVASLGQIPAIAAPAKPEPESLAIEFGDLTTNVGLTRRQAISRLSRRHHLSARDVYAALEQAKSQANDQLDRP